MSSKSTPRRGLQGFRRYTKRSWLRQKKKAWIKPNTQSLTLFPAQPPYPCAPWRDGKLFPEGRSEERRVGKECGWGGEREDDKSKHMHRRLQQLETKVRQDARGLQGNTDTLMQQT